MSPIGLLWHFVSRFFTGAALYEASCGRLIRAGTEYEFLLARICVRAHDSNMLIIPFKAFTPLRDEVLASRTAEASSSLGLRRWAGEDGFPRMGYDITISHRVLARRINQ
jgi:hypothetical protein